MRNKILIFILILAFLQGCVKMYPPLMEEAPTPPIEGSAGWTVPGEGDFSTQGTRPDQAPQKDPEGSDAIYTQENGSLSKVRFDSARNYFVSGIIQGTLSYAVDTVGTSNPDSLRGYFVKDNSSRWFYVDSDKRAFRLAAGASGSAQTLSIASNTLSISDGNSVDLSAYLDNTDAQDLSLSSNTLSLTGDASSVDLSGYLDNTDAQTLSFTNPNLSISGGNSVDLSALSGGSADGVATSGTFDDANNEIDITVASPGSSFSIDIQPLMDSINAMTGGGSSIWTENGSDIYYTAGNVGIGQSIPVYPLDILGNLRVDGNIYGSGGGATQLTLDVTNTMLRGNRNLDLFSAGGYGIAVKINGNDGPGIFLGGLVQTKDLANQSEIIFSTGSPRQEYAKLSSDGVFSIKEVFQIEAILGANAPSSPSEGTIIHVSDTATSPFTTAGLYVYLGSTWNIISITAVP